MRFPRGILENRLKRFQERLSGRAIDAVMLRTLSGFTYFTGIRWLRPALLIPANGSPIAFIASSEEDEFFKRTWIKNVITYTEGGDLMAKVSETIRRNKYKVVGMEFAIERDAYILFYEMFKLLNPNVKVVDVSSTLTDMRKIKDDYELRAISKAGKIASNVMNKLLPVIETEITETDIAAKAYNLLLRSGCEMPHVYINVGPNPRIHAIPTRDIKVKKDIFVTITIGADYNGYYANISRTVYTGKLQGLAERAFKCMNELYEVAKEHTRVGVRFIDVMKLLDDIYKKYGLLEHRAIGYAHGVGLQVEESPITTILPKDRFIEVQPRMSLAFIHSPLVLKGLGQVKVEDTFIIREDGILVT